jgi:hypothetical protein
VSEAEKSANWRGQMLVGIRNPSRPSAARKLSYSAENDCISGKIQLGEQDCTSRAFQRDDKAFRISKISGTGLTNFSAPTGNSS